jgi:hypothetical protein
VAEGDIAANLRYLGWPPVTGTVAGACNFKGLVAVATKTATEWLVSVGLGAALPLHGGSGTRRNRGNLRIRRPLR